MGGKVGRASIKLGHCHDGLAEASVPIGPEQLDAAWWAAIGGEILDPQLRDRVEREAVVLLAGPVVEVRAGERGLIAEEPRVSRGSPAARTRLLAALASGEQRPATDLEATDELLRRVTASPAEAAAYREMLIERTYTLVSMRPRFWPLAEAVAGELLIRDELTADEAGGCYRQSGWRGTP